MSWEVILIRGYLLPRWQTVMSLTVTRYILNLMLMLYVVSCTASAPVFVPNPVRVIATLGKDVSLECKPRASPKPRITWKRGDRRLQPNKRWAVFFLFFFCLFYMNTFISTFCTALLTLGINNYTIKHTSKTGYHYTKHLQMRFCFIDLAMFGNQSDWRAWWVWCQSVNIWLLWLPFVLNGL